MTFTQYLWQEATPIFEKIRAHPFNQELRQGTLPTDAFTFYIYQDSLYLADFARALAVAGTRAATSQELLDFLQFAQNAILVERALHESYFDEYRISYTSGKAPGCFAYTNYLLAVSTLESYEVAVAALLPCFWIYKEIGDYIYAHQTTPNPYQNWISTYAGEEFGEAVRKVLGICDRLAEQASESTRQRMREAYLTSSRLEYLFWDSAYRREAWPV
ncbi:thiaminase II [Rhabdobacter roseus]|uniref:Aminopyrimidine aminohydrolase n=1 Tax=Rhabdobacter roseus TaxID=1655419 RepID=A0A840U085_9BACT|nr:thiaminase II [Rhabdobacter roseus]MBB5285550.1 thiaminase/transcriptional activator TenA [Rhabdobacter roseus]